MLSGRKLLRSISVCVFVCFVNILMGITEIPKWNQATSTAAVTLADEVIEEVKHSIYLGSIVDTQGGTEADLLAWIGKSLVAFIQL